MEGTCGSGRVQYSCMKLIPVIHWQASEQCSSAILQPNSPEVRECANCHLHKLSIWPREFISVYVFVTILI